MTDQIAKDQEVTNRSTRMIAGTAYKNGLTGSLDLLNRLRSGPHKANSPESGLDLDIIAGHAANAASITLAFSVAGIVMWILGWLLLINTLSFLAIIFHFIGSALIIYEMIYLRWSNARLFLRHNYDSTLKPDAKFLKPLSTMFEHQILQKTIQPEPNQNVITFGGYRPFLGAGIRISGWTLSIERKPAKDSNADHNTHINIPLHQFYQAADEAVKNLELRDIKQNLCLFVNGYELEPDEVLLKSRDSHPLATLPEERIQDFFDSDLLIDKRAYQLFSYHDKVRDNLLSYFLRFYNIGAITFVETSVHTLTNVDQSRYSLSSLLDESATIKVIKTAFFTLLLAVLYSIYVIPALFNVYRYGSTLLAWRGEDKRQKQSAKSAEEYNYGLVQTFRESVAAPFYQNYFGVQDLTMYWKTLDEAVLSSIVKTLKNHGVEVSKFEEQAAGIINNGVMVTGGEFTANQVAAGKGAASIMGSVSSNSQETRVGKVVGGITKAVTN
ncbi:MAG: hypothetical protein IPJ94_27950 [Chloroflexi bacterium]|nr:hypothetical protein [Chloroflexota bacterium]